MLKGLKVKNKKQKDSNNEGEPKLSSIKIS